MLKYLLISCLVVFQSIGAQTVFSNVYNSNIDNKSVQVLNLTMALEPGVWDKTSPEYWNEVLNYWADGIYEMTNGGHYLGEVRIFKDVNMRTDEDKAATTNYDVNVYLSDIGAYAIPNGFLKAKKSIYVNIEGNYLDINGDKVNKKPKRMAGTLTHEGMHYFYGLLDEYGQAHLGPQCYGCDDLTSINIAAIENSNKINFSVPSDAWDNFEKFSEPYQVGAEVEIRLYRKGDNPDRVVPTISDLGVSADKYFIYIYDSKELKKIQKLEIKKTTKIKPTDDNPGSFELELVYKDGTLAGQDLNFTSKGKDFHLSFPQSFWSAPFSLSWRSGYDDGTADDEGMINPAWMNISSKINVMPHNPQGRKFRDINNEACSQWDVLSGDCKMSADKLNVVSRVNSWVDLKDYSPKSTDEETYINSYCSDVSLLKYKWIDFLNPTGAYDESYWEDWYSCRTKSRDPTSDDITMDYTKNVLDPAQPDLAHPFLEVIWEESELKQEVAIVLDISGSMRENNKWDLAKVATTSLINLWSNVSSTQKMRISAFNEELKHYLVFDRITPPFNILSAALKILVLKNLDEIEPSGNTAMYDGLYTAISYLGSTDVYKEIYLISDGLDNSSSHTKSEIIALAKENFITINAVAYGNNADTETLAELANLTGGDYREELIFSLENIMEGVASSLANAYSFDRDTTFSLNSMTQNSLYVEENTQTLKLVLVGENIDVNNIEVLNPSGSVVSTENIKLSESENLADVYTLSVENNNLESGNWVVKNNSDNSLLLSPLKISQPNSSLHFTVEVLPTYQISYPKPVFITANLSGGYALTNYNIKAILTRPDGTTEDIMLNDDGVDGDDISGDGMYTWRYTSYTQEGYHQVRIDINNKDSTAEYTLEGLSISEDTEIPEFTQNFSKSRTRGFSIKGIVSDDHSNTVVDASSLSVDGDAKFARIDYISDADVFMLEDLDFTNQTYVYLSSTNKNINTNIVLYNGSGSIIEEYSFNTWEKMEISIPNEYMSTGIAIGVSANSLDTNSTEVGTTYSLQAFSKESGSFAVGRFEEVTDWSSAQGGVSVVQENAYEGDGSLKLVSSGWNEVKSRDVSTFELLKISDTLSLEAYIPDPPVNSYWVGTLELKVEVASTTEVFSLGTKDLTNIRRGRYTTLDWTVSQALKNRLKEDHPDIRFILVLNGNAPIWVDDLKFTGELEANNPAMSEIACPGPGCTPASAIDLGVMNNSRRFNAYGDIWFKISEFPSDWSPNKLHIGLGSEDGQALTGIMVVDIETGVEQDLNQYYQQFSYDYSFNQPVYIRVSNNSGRAYRIQWWADMSGSYLAYNF